MAEINLAKTLHLTATAWLGSPMRTSVMRPWFAITNKGNAQMTQMCFACHRHSSSSSLASTIIIGIFHHHHHHPSSSSSSLISLIIPLIIIHHH
jgi:hypothetical protein